MLSLLKSFALLYFSGDWLIPAIPWFCIFTGYLQNGASVFGVFEAIGCRDTFILRCYRFRKWKVRLYIFKMQRLKNTKFSTWKALFIYLLSVISSPKRFNGNQKEDYPPEIRDANVEYSSQIFTQMSSSAKHGPEV